MAEGRSQDQWNHTAALLALIANCHRDPKRSRAYTVGDFHPLMAHTPAHDPRADIAVLKAVFIDRTCPEIP